MAVQIEIALEDQVYSSDQSLGNNRADYYGEVTCFKYKFEGTQFLGRYNRQKMRVPEPVDLLQKKLFCQFHDGYENVDEN